MSKSLYFIALIPPNEIRNQVEAYRNIMADQFQSKQALKSPAHITLIPPFYWSDDRYEQIKLDLAHWASQKVPFEIQLFNFSHFEPKVLYVDVLPNPTLVGLQGDLQEYFKDKWDIDVHRNKVFHPHMTIAFKDLKIDQFYNAWQYLMKEDFSATFLVDKISVLQYSNQKWEIRQELPMDQK
ncbi:MAG: 2'-5' RNA ligase family protein [Saprospiraceae bacterium]|nr:2'-5' RNA ligase family protein [Saprospiraceae bacterium]